MFTWLSEGNSKLKKSSIPVVSWGLPAGETCPQAGTCKDICYAKHRRYKWQPAIRKRSRNLALALSGDFIPNMRQDLLRLPHGWFVRIHDSGDFFSAQYLRAWLELMGEFPGNSFYAYTKSVSLLANAGELPRNFRPILSLGGREDRLVNICSQRHARIFETAAELVTAGYEDGSKDDAVAATSKALRIGLVRKK